MERVPPFHAAPCVNAARALPRPCIRASGESSGKDVWVLNEAEKRFVDEVRGSGGDIVMERIPDSVHEIFSMPNEVLEPYVHKVLDFFGTPALTVIGKDV